MISMGGLKPAHRNIKKNLHTTPWITVLRWVAAVLSHYQV